jgi:uncharacterized membrane protein YraQ (UPF0718 family)
MNDDHPILRDTALHRAAHCCADSPQGKRPGVGTLAEGIFFACAVAALLLWREAPLFRTLAVTFTAIVLEALPFMLAGSLAGGLIETFITEERMSRLMPTGRRGVFLAASLGLVLPVCECAVVPIVRRLLGKGVSPAAAVAYLLAGPIANPLVFLSTGTAYSFHWSTALARLALGYAIGVSTGLFLQRMFGPGFRDAMLRESCPAKDEAPSCACKEGHLHGPGCEPPVTGGVPRVWSALVHGSEDFLDTCRFLVLGALAAAVAQTMVPRELLAALAGSPVLAIVSAMAMAVGLNLCSEADAFVAASMRSMWPFAAQMTFMLLGPMLDMKLLFMYRAVFRGRFIAVLAGTVAVSVFLAALGIHLLFKR